MPSQFGRYQSGIEAATGNLVPAYSQMADRTANAIAGFGQNLAAGIQKYQANEAEAEMINEEAKAIGSQLQQFESIFGNNPEYAPFAKQLSGYIDKVSKIPEMSLAQKRGALNGAKVAFSQIGTQLQMFTAMKEENAKRLTAEGLAGAPKSEKVIEDFSVDAGRTSINSSEPISVQRGKFAENLTKDAVWNKDQNAWIRGTGEKIDLSQALKNWDAGAKQTLKQAETAGNPTATVMLEQLEALAKRREGEQYRANLAEGQTTDDAMYNMGRGTESVTAPSAEALMKMRGTTPSEPAVGLDTALNNQINKLKINAATETNKQLTTDIANYDKQIKELANVDLKNPNFSDMLGYEFGGIDPRVGVAASMFPVLAPLALGTGIKRKSETDIAKAKIAKIEELNNQKQAAVQSIEDNKKELQQLQGTETGEAKPVLSVALPKVTVGTQEKEYAVSEEKTKAYVRDWVTQNMGITQTVTNPDGTTRTVKVTPANFDSIYRTLRPTPKVVSMGGYDLLEKGNGEYDKLGESKGRGTGRADRAKEMKETFGKEPIYKGDEKLVYAPEGLIPEPLYIGTKDGAKYSGVSLVGTYTGGGNAEKWKNEFSSMLQAESAVERLIEISNNPAEATSFDLSNEAQALAFQVKAGAKERLVGSQVTGDEWKMLADYIVDTTKIANMETAERRKLNVVLGKVKADIENAKTGSGVTVLDNRKNRGSAGDIIGQKKIDKRLPQSR
jgi:hypothetical protein